MVERPWSGGRGVLARRGRNRAVLRADACKQGKKPRAYSPGNILGSFSASAEELKSVSEGSSVEVLNA